ncbi:MAG: hypothetical protein ACK4G3_03175, partial [bacterium]
MGGGYSFDGFWDAGNNGRESRGRTIGTGGESSEELCASAYVPIPGEELLYPVVKADGSMQWLPFTYFFRNLSADEAG